MSNDKANAAYHGRTERPTPPADTRHGWDRNDADEWATPPKPASSHTATRSAFDDGPAVEPTWRNLALMLGAAAVLIGIVGGLYLELVALS